MASKDKMIVSVYDTKSYSKQYLQFFSKDKDFELMFYDFLLSKDTALTAKGSKAVSIFVNDKLDSECLHILFSIGVKFILLRCTGYNNVDLKVAKELGFTVTKCSYSPYGISEFTVGMILSVIRKIHKASNRTKEMNFSLNGLVGFELYGKTAGILGTGKIGQLVCMALKGLGMRVIAYDEYKNIEWANKYDIIYVNDLNYFLSQSDIISIHIPLTDKTHHLFDFNRMKLLKKGVIIINTSRGGILETSALIAYIKSGHIGGVGLDVFEEEDGLFGKDISDQIIQDDVITRLLTFPNVLVTGHQAYLTSEALIEIAKTTCHNLDQISRNSTDFILDSVLLDSLSA